jgi:hypothetical protein
MLQGMRAFCTLLFAFCTAAYAQSPCASASTKVLERRVHEAQRAVLAYRSPPMDSGVSPEVAPLLIHLKDDLADAADHILDCASDTEPASELQARLKAFLHAAAPGMRQPAEDTGTADFAKPEVGYFGNDVDASMTLHAGPPRLLLVTLSESLPCGPDSQLIIYEPKNGHWQRALRWSADFRANDGIGLPWGDFFLTRIMVPSAAHTDQWRAVVAHGTPWCTSRFSSFGLSVLAPSSEGARVLWQTIRGFSRGDFVPRLKVSGDTFEFRINEDAMLFDMANAFERTVIYRYRVTNGGVTRLEPVAMNGLGFVEEWLSMPWIEAAEQSVLVPEQSLRNIHERYETSYQEKSDKFTTWTAGAVQACSAKDHFQIAFQTELDKIVPGKPGGETSNEQRHYFQIQHVPEGYQMISVSAKPDLTCTGPNLIANSGK